VLTCVVDAFNPVTPPTGTRRTAVSHSELIVDFMIIIHYYSNRLRLDMKRKGLRRLRSSGRGREHFLNCQVKNAACYGFLMRKTD